MGTDDELLAGFQRREKEARAGIGADAAAEGEQYEAFKAVDGRQLSIHVRPVGEPSLWVRYASWLHIVDEPNGRRLDVYFQSVVVTLTGRHLGEVSAAIADERCAFVQAFTATKWAKPKDESAAFIESIAYLTVSPPEMIAEKDAA